MRLFVGIDFPEKIKEEIYQLILLLKKKYPEVKWEKKENLHLTLKFLGYIKLKAQNSTPNQNKFGPGLPRTELRSGTGAKLKKIIKGMERGVAGIKPFEVKIERLGYFLRNAFIVWLGMIEKTGGLKRLVKKLDREMGKLGFKKEKRPFHPHATLGRRRRVVPMGKWRGIAEEIAGREVGSEKWEVRKITLFESKLSREGSTYKVVAEVDL